MKYCADTWYMIKLATKDAKALDIKRNILEGKDALYLPTIVITELFRKLMQKGKSVDSVVAATCRVSSCDRLLFDDEDLKKLHRKYFQIEFW